MTVELKEGCGGTSALESGPYDVFTLIMNAHESIKNGWVGGVPVRLLALPDRMVQPGIANNDQRKLWDLSRQAILAEARGELQLAAKDYKGAFTEHSMAKTMLEKAMAVALACKERGHRDDLVGVMEFVQARIQVAESMLFSKMSDPQSIADSCAIVGNTIGAELIEGPANSDVIGKARYSQASIVFSMKAEFGRVNRNFKDGLMSLSAGDVVADPFVEVVKALDETDMTEGVEKGELSNLRACAMSFGCFVGMVHDLATGNNTRAQDFARMAYDASRNDIRLKVLPPVARAVWNIMGDRPVDGITPNMVAEAIMTTAEIVTNEIFLRLEALIMGHEKMKTALGKAKTKEGDAVSPEEKEREGRLWSAYIFEIVESVEQLEPLAALAGTLCSGDEIKGRAYDLIMRTRYLAQIANAEYLGVKVYYGNLDDFPKLSILTEILIRLEDAQRMEETITGPSWPVESFHAATIKELEYTTVTLGLKETRYLEAMNHYPEALDVYDSIISQLPSDPDVYTSSPFRAYLVYEVLLYRYRCEAFLEHDAGMNAADPGTALHHFDEEACILRRAYAVVQLLAETGYVSDDELGEIFYTINDMLRTAETLAEGQTVDDEDRPKTIFSKDKPEVPYIG